MNNLVKSSGIDWIGSIPSDWKCERIKNILCERNETNKPIKTEDILSLTNDRGVIPYSEKGAIGNNSKDDLTGYKLAYPNDIVLNSMNVIIGSIGLSKYFGCVSPVYYMLYLRNKNDSIEYFNYLFQTKELQNRLKGYGNGIMEIRMRIQMSKLNTVMLPYPPSKVQFAIVNKIKESEAKIDLLISNQKRQIQKLEDYKLSTITKTVTLGINKNIETKDSNIAWIGSIPSNWSTIKIKFTSWLKGRIGWDGLKSSEFIDEGPFLITGTDFQNGTINWNTCVHISNERFEQDKELHINENDLLITKDGTIGKLAIVKNCPEKVSLNSGVMIIRNNSAFKYDSKYLYYILSSNQFLLWYQLSQSGNSTIKHLYQGQFYNFQYTFPPYSEQEKIANFLDVEIANIERLIEIKKEKVNKMLEYKKALIYEYVTGKKESI